MDTNFSSNKNIPYKVTLSLYHPLIKEINQYHFIIIKLLELWLYN